MRIRGSRGVATLAGLVLATTVAATGGATESGVASQTATAAVEPDRGSVTNLPLPRFVSLRAESANARRGPSLSHRVDWTFVQRGLPLEVTAEYGHWRRIRDVDGMGGWVHHSLLSGVRTVLVRGEALTALHVATADTAPIRAYVEPGVVGRLERCEDAWCRVNLAGADGWIRRGALWGVE
jgi:SH3-like domain-containing protein